MDVAPVRLCCGQRHRTVACPDGFVMCCLCFERVGQDDLSVDEHGDKWDVCKPCREAELKEMERRGRSSLLRVRGNR